MARDHPNRRIDRNTKLYDRASKTHELELAVPGAERARPAHRRWKWRHSLKHERSTATRSCKRRYVDASSGARLPRPGRPARGTCSPKRGVGGKPHQCDLVDTTTRAKQHHAMSTQTQHFAHSWRSVVSSPWMRRPHRCVPTGHPRNTCTSTEGGRGWLDQHGTSTKSVWDAVGTQNMAAEQRNEPRQHQPLQLHRASFQHNGRPTQELAGDDPRTDSGPDVRARRPDERPLWTVDDLSSADAKRLNDLHHEVLVCIRARSPEIADDEHVRNNDLHVPQRTRSFLKGYASGETKDTTPRTCDDNPPLKDVHRYTLSRALLQRRSRGCSQTHS